MKTTAKWFWAIVAAQAIFLLAWAGYHEGVRRHAPVLRLKGQPVDPQDLLRGDYMTLRYDIGSAPIDGGGGKPLEPGQDVWVLLEKRGGYHVVVQASRTELQPAAGQVLVRGEAVSDWRGARIDYGIERYFVPEGKGAPRFKAMEVEAAVSADHRLYLRRVVLDGKTYP
ncbi:MAG TPA: GDYXXLXY domain-containing protein [Opitutaceae bacterium]|nr:GDYXXLXY domain-containing protein [Opitutaceae bacterium]